MSTDTEVPNPPAALTLGQQDRHLAEPEVDTKGVPQTTPEHLQPTDAVLAAVSKAELKRYSLAFGLTTWGFGSAFGCASGYLAYQLQYIAYFGKDFAHNPGMPAGSGCLELDAPCLVPFGGTDLNLTSILLYLNAIAFVVSGALTLLVCGLGDHLSELGLGACISAFCAERAEWKREQYIFGLVLYGALCLPAAGLTAYTQTMFNAIAVIYTLFTILGFLVQAWMNIFVPYTMNTASPIDRLTATARRAALAGQTDAEVRRLRAVREIEGVKVSVFGTFAMTLGMMMLFIVTIGVTYAGETVQLSAGMYVTSSAGAGCIVAALGGWRFLPAPSGRPFAQGAPVWKIPLVAFVSLAKGVYCYSEAFKWLLAYTIYNDSFAAYGLVSNTLFNNVVRPSVREYTLYNIVGCIVSLVTAPIFVYLYPRTRLTLRHWAVASYAAVCFMALWMMIGMNANSSIGFKHRAEFYAFQVAANASLTIAVSSFRVLFPQMFPRGEEIQYFGFQLVLSCSTTWIPQIVNGPIVDKTDNIRLPAVIAFVFFLASVALTWWVDEERGIEIIRREEMAKLDSELEQEET